MPPNSPGLGVDAGSRSRRPRRLEARLAQLARELFGQGGEVLAVGLPAALARHLEAPWPARARGISALESSAEVHASEDGAASLSFRFIAEPSQTDALGARFAGALWWMAGTAPPQRSLRSGLGALRARLCPGASVLLLAPVRAPAWVQLRALVSRARRDVRPTLETLPQSLLLSGLCGARVQAGPPGWFAVSAQLPAVRCALDVFFEQPAATARR